MPEYTAMAAFAAVAVMALVVVVGPNLFKLRSYWITLAIVFAFQVPVDGWLTKAGNTIVLYDPTEIIGLRVGWNTPIEDFAFGYALVTLALLGWVRQK